MVEVFKTTVNTSEQASVVLQQIHKEFSDYQANFDLQDCDNILRVECRSGPVADGSIISLLTNLSLEAEVLPDEIEEFSQQSF